jgi:hypothetical protein
MAAPYFFPQKVALELPFTPSVSPKWQIVRCEGGGPKRDDLNLDVRDFISFRGGYLVGYDSGEFGGGLFHFDTQGRFVRSLTAENTVRIVPTASGAIVFTGLAHGGSDNGHVLRLGFNKNRWRTKSIRLPGAPRIVLPEANGSFLVLTRRHLVRVTPDFRVVPLHRGAWGGNVPNSMVSDTSGVIYIGMSYAVARVRPTGKGYVEEWLAPRSVRLSVVPS